MPKKSSVNHDTAEDESLPFPEAEKPFEGKKIGQDHIAWLKGTYTTEQLVALTNKYGVKSIEDLTISDMQKIVEKYNNARAKEAQK